MDAFYTAACVIGLAALILLMLWFAVCLGTCMDAMGGPDDDEIGARDE